MNFLVIGRFYDESFAGHIAGELEALGHKTVRFDPAAKLVAFGSRARFYLNRALSVSHDVARSIAQSLGRGGIGRALTRTIARSEPIDLVLSIHDYLSPDDAALVKRLTKAPLALWFPDPIWTFGRHMFLNAPYDFLFFKDPYLVDMFRQKLGKPAYYLPEAFSPASIDPDRVGVVGQEWSCDVTVAGNLYAYRVALFQEVARRHRVRVWGVPAPLWLDPGTLAGAIQNRFVAHDDKARAFRGAKIVLNTHNPAEIAGTNVRTFEAAGAGAFVLTDYKVGLADLFELDREIVTFDDAGDLLQKLEHYLDDEALRRRIAEGARARALRDHTYAVRLAMLLDTVSGRSAGYPEPEPVWHVLTRGTR